MSDGPVEPVLKRKRITIACNSCRAKKSKCDGKRPVCGRCTGYDYICTWGSAAGSQDTVVSQSPVSPSGIEVSRQLFIVYQQLVQSFTPLLPRDARVEVSNCLAIVQARLASFAPVHASSPPSHQAATTTVQPVQNRRYLGEISDVHFCKIVKQAAKSDGDSRDTNDDVDDYDLEEPVTPRHLSDPLTDMPVRVEVEENLLTYFSTIHFAYPFVSKASFMSKVKTLQAKGATAGLTPSWLSLLYALLAVGAYYNSFCQRHKRADVSHQRLFQQSLNWSENALLERSLTQTSALLAQCFYLLATSQIDRCWSSLGLAIRLGQSIGLHVNVEGPTMAESVTSHELDRSAIRGRVWYCLYVLDRLLALQLGRPPAISDPDCHVPIPHRLVELELDDQDARESDARVSGESGWRSDYFACIIEFSSIIGRVLRETYHPRREIEASLKSTKNCDRRLLDWKERLPPHLRFDHGHLFEQSVTFKRQRNMLAIKFHHLRTLIHRPYLCYPHLKGQRMQTLLPGQLAQIREYGNTCTSEAQLIARLMYNVTDTSDIVLNYPWWQMISCLVCAGSVMVLAETFTKHETSADYKPAPSSLGRDIETCVQVLHALSGNSNGAKLACDMLRSIRARGARISDKIVDGSPGTSPGLGLEMHATKDDGRQEGQQTCSYSSGFGFEAEPAVLEQPEFGLPTGEMGGVEPGVDFCDASLWPMVVPDSMNWPAEFLGAFQSSEESPQSLFRVQY